MYTVTLTTEQDVHRKYIPLKPSNKVPHKVLKLKESRDLKVYEVERDCALGEFVEGKCDQGEFKRGCAFYELTDKKENIYEGQEIILQKKV